MTLRRSTTGTGTYWWRREQNNRFSLYPCSNQKTLKVQLPNQLQYGRSVPISLAILLYCICLQKTLSALKFRTSCCSSADLQSNLQHILQIILAYLPILQHILPHIRSVLSSISAYIRSDQQA